MCSLTYTRLIAADSSSHKPFTIKKPLAWTVIGTGVVGTHAALYQTWYKDYRSTAFHWFNDNREWLQMDKVGHAFSAYIIGTNSAGLFRMAGYSRRTSAWLGAATGLAFQMPIEVFDGYSSGWGASKGDMLANLTGTLWAGVQNYCWGRPKVPFRITFHFSEYALSRPALLGKNLPQRMLKDYNGQTYWLDLNPQRMGIRPNWWPKWLGFNIGYGAEGMLGGHDNIWESGGVIYDYSEVRRYRQYYIGPSVSFGYLQQSKSPGLQLLGFVTDRIRLPLPVLEYNRPFGFKMHWIYW